MISLVALARAARELTSDAVKFGAQLAIFSVSEHTENGVLKLGTGAQKRLEKKFGMTACVMLKCAIELAEVGLLDRVGRIGFSTVASSVSDGPRTLALSSPAIETVSTGCQLLGAPRDKADAVRGADARGGDSVDAVDAVGEKLDCSHAVGETKGTGTAEVSGERSEATRERSDAALNGVVRPTLALSAHGLVVKSFFDLFTNATGQKPRFGGAEGNIVSTLLKSFSAEEIVRRMTIMFTESRKFPAPPYDLRSLSTHFNLFAVSSKKVTGPRDNDPMKRGASYYGAVDE